MADIPDSCGGDLLANSLLNSLLEGRSVTLPEIDFDDDAFKIPEEKDNRYGEISRITIDDLTEKKVDGSGVFDALMTSIGAHLRNEYESSRITGQEYTKAYIAIVGGALQTAVQFLLGKDQAYWNAVMAEQQARAAEIAVVTARVGLETAKVSLALAQYQALTAEATYGLTKMKISTEDAQFCLIKAQTEGVQLDIAAKDYTNQFILPLQKDLLGEQVEVQRAQTSDTRTDGDPVKGSVGKQKELYSQQITSYQRDAEVKAAKLFTDAWITQKTIDEGLLPPDNFNNSSLNAILGKLKTNNSLT